MRKLLSPKTVVLSIGLLTAVLYRIGFLFFFGLDTPFHQGGLFWEFSRQISANHYLLPNTIPFYSEGGIPFAYPPLPFYIEALLTDLFNLPKFATVDLFPPILAVLSLPSIYFLALRLTRDRAASLAVLFFYAFIPNSILNQIEGGGIAESSGTLALIWYGYFLVGLYEKPGWKNALLSGLLLAVCVMASPGSALASAPVSLLFALAMLLKSEKKLPVLGNLLGIAFVGLLVSSPYWLTVMADHGRGIFLVSVLGQFQAGGKPLPFTVMEKLLKFNLGGGGYPFLWNAIAFLAVLWAIVKRRWLVLAIFFVFLITPREGDWMTPLPAAILVGQAFAEWLVPQYRSVTETYGRQKVFVYAALAIIAIGLIYSSYNALYELVVDPQLIVSEQNITDLVQAQQYIPENAFVVVFGNDGFVEWSPQLLRRTVVDVKYGLEWKPDQLAHVDKFLADYQNSQTWPQILQAAHTDLGYSQVYIIGSSRRELTSISNASGPEAGIYKVIHDFPSMELGLLSSPGH